MIKPLADRIVVEILEEEEQTQGGVILPDMAREKPQRGKVVAVGIGAPIEGIREQPDGSHLRMLEVKVGDTVVFSKYAGIEITVDGAERLIMRESDVLGVLS